MPEATWTFGTVLWWTLGVFFWFAIIWVFIGVFADILRRHDLSGWAKGGWVLLIVVLPFIGALIYLIARPPVPVAARERQMLDGYEVRAGREPGATAASELATAADLKAKGLISDSEFEAIKQRVLH
jgi:Short C-terminal domain/Phospholipase_D-nuclease N-terminal